MLDNTIPGQGRFDLAFEIRRQLVRYPFHSPPAGYHRAVLDLVITTKSLGIIGGEAITVRWPSHRVTRSGYDKRMVSKPPGDTPRRHRTGRSVAAGPAALAVVRLYRPMIFVRSKDYQ